jgi:SAM-dependent methyltransferase
MEPGIQGVAGGPGRRWMRYLSTEECGKGRVVRGMPGIGGIGGDEAANRELWTRVNAEYGEEHAVRAWAAQEITWGVFNVPEAQVGVLGEVSGLDVAELGCGTAYLSAWLARRGARMVGVDVTPAQLGTARRCQAQFGIRFPLVEADAGNIPLADASFDLVVSECGASLWCDPARWVPEAARLLRPGGRLVFHTTTALAAMCAPAGSLTAGNRTAGDGTAGDGIAGDGTAGNRTAGDGTAGRELRHPQREVARVRRPGRGVEFHPGHGEWIRLLTAAGLVVDALHELYAPPEAGAHAYYDLAPPDWAQRWPAEEIWAAHLPAA